MLFPFVQLASYPTDPFAYILFTLLVIALLLVDAAMFSYGWRRGLLRMKPTPRWLRFEIAQSAAAASVFLLTIPPALLIGPFVTVMWLATIPVQALLAHRQADEFPA